MYDFVDAGYGDGAIWEFELTGAESIIASAGTGATVEVDAPPDACDTGGG